MSAANWGHLQLLWLLAIVPVLVVAYAFDGQRRRRALERIGHLPMIRRMTASISPARRRWKAVLTVAAVALLVTTLARPQVQGKGRLTENRGLDLVVALDFSKSMLARDVYPSRLERAKAELSRLIDSLKGDRVGLVAFAGETLAYPLTVDYEAAKLFWRDLQPDDMPVGGTDLGRAIAAAGDLLKQSRDAEHARRPNAKRHPAQVILLLTDGEDTEGRGIDAARSAARDGVKIFTLGIGSNERPFVQTYDEEGKPNGMLSDTDGRPVRVGLDEQALREIAQLTGGEYLTVDPQRFGVERVQSAIAGLERTEEEARFEREPEDIGRFLLVPAFLLLVLGAIVRERRRNANANVNVNANVNENANANAKARESTGQRAIAAMILFLLFPFIGGFDLFLRRDPNVEEGNRLLNAGKADEALRAYDRAVTAMPEDPIAHFDRGAALYQLGKYPEAQKEFLHAAEGRDAQVKADAYYNMGNAWFQQQKFKEALEAYKHTLGLRPDDRRAKWNLELALKKLEEQKKQQQQQQQQQQNQDQQKQDDKQQQQAQGDKQQQQQNQDQQKQDDKQQQQQTQNDSPERNEKEKQRQLAQKEKKEPPREIDKQDAEAVLDALERVEPTVQKDLARRRAGNRRPSKDW